MTATDTEDGAPMWLVLPTYNEASNLEASSPRSASA